MDPLSLGAIIAAGVVTGGSVVISMRKMVIWARLRKSPLSSGRAKEKSNTRPGQLVDESHDSFFKQC
jgi:hypothetical protein